MRKGADFATLDTMTEIIPESDPRAEEYAVQALLAGELVVLPTDTVYGLAAAANNEDGVRKLFAAKNRPPSKALPLFLADASMAPRVAEVTPVASALMSAFWPGALTIVMRRNPGYFSLALGDSDTVGVRVPDYAFVRNVVRGCNQPVTGTSANRSGARSAVTAAEAALQLGPLVAVVIDGGTLGQPGAPGTRSRALESTIVDITQPEGPVILREGAVSREELKRVLGDRLA